MTLIVPRGKIMRRWQCIASHPSGLFTAAGIITLRQRADGERACQAFVAGRDEPLKVPMHHVALEGYSSSRQLSTRSGFCLKKSLILQLSYARSTPPLTLSKAPPRTAPRMFAPPPPPSNLTFPDTSTRPCHTKSPPMTRSPCTNRRPYPVPFWIFTPPAL